MECLLLDKNRECKSLAAALIRLRVCPVTLVHYQCHCQCATVCLFSGKLVRALSQFVTDKWLSDKEAFISVDCKQNKDSQSSGLESSFTSQMAGAR